MTASATHGPLLFGHSIVGTTCTSEFQKSKTLFVTLILKCETLDSGPLIPLYRGFHGPITDADVSIPHVYLKGGEILRQTIIRASEGLSGYFDSKSVCPWLPTALKVKTKNYATASKSIMVHTAHSSWYHKTLCFLWSVPTCLSFFSQILQAPFCYNSFASSLFGQKPLTTH